MSSIVPRVGIPQGQEMCPEVKSGALVAGRGTCSAVGRESSSRDSQILSPNEVYPPGFWEASLIPSE